MTAPLVSVLIPCYNAEEYVEDAISSILKQTYRNMEIIAIDDCSTTAQVQYCAAWRPPTAA